MCLLLFVKISFFKNNAKKSQDTNRPWYHHLNSSVFHLSSVQFSLSVVSDSLWPHELQHARPPCPSPTPGVHSDSCPSSQWCHPAVSSSVVPFFSCPQSLPASKSFPVSQLFAWGGQSTAVSSVLVTFNTFFTCVLNVYIFAVIDGIFCSAFSHSTMPWIILRFIENWKSHSLSIR